MNEGRSISSPAPKCVRHWGGWLHHPQHDLMSCFRVIVSLVLSVLTHRPQDSSATFRRVGLASLLFAVARPRDARAAALERTALRLTMSLGPREIPMRDIHAVSLERQWAWGGVRIRTARGDTVVSGLRHREAATLAAAAEEARIAWWREFLVEHADALRAIDARLADLEAPQCYVRRRAFSSLVEEAQRAASVLPQWWPERLDGEPVVQSVKRIRSFLSDPEAARKRANQIFAIGRIDARLSELKAPESYVRHRAFTALVKTAKRAPSSLREWCPEQVDPEPTVQALNRIRSFLSDPETVRKRANKTFLEAELKRSRGFLDKVEARPLTEEQRQAVCVDDDRNLVVAAAGSGKTSIMVAKAGWIVERGDRQPEDLLLLAFARPARDELEQRVKQRLGARVAGAVTSQTFHSLGLSIIGEAEGRRPALAKVAEDRKALLDLLNGIIAKLQGHPQHGRALIRWLAYDATPYRSEHEFRSQGEYWDYIRNREIRSLKGELVKSFEECRIANFLYLNGVSYEYERPYEHATATARKVQYKPDFYLRDAGIYIEHFALSENGNTPPFIDRAKYTEERKWKLELHVKHGTTLIETFSHEQAAGQLTERLADKLRAHGVALNPIPREEIFAVLNEQGRVEPFTQLVATFLHHFKGARLTIEAVEGRASGKRDGGRSEAFLRVFRPIFERYEAKLADAGEIDFHDMINRATDHVSAGRYRSPFGYILVDEFQDISPGRAALLKALLDQSVGAQLFVVGDDWQAIFRFAGSDIAVMRGFEERFGAGARSDLETTFRCSDGPVRRGHPLRARQSRADREEGAFRPARRRAGRLDRLRRGRGRAAPAPGARPDCDRGRPDGRPAERPPARAVQAPDPGPETASAEPSGPGPYLPDRARREGAGGRLRRGTRHLLGPVRVPDRDHRRPAPRLGARRARRAPKRGGAPALLRRPDARQAADVPAGGGRTTLGFRRGTPASGRPDRHLRLAECGRSALPRMQEGAPRAADE